MRTAAHIYATVPMEKHARSFYVQECRFEFRNAGGKRFSTCVNLDFLGLLAVGRRGLRNGNRRKLSVVDRGLFRCAL